MPDAVVVGAGPNGLAAAVELARAGCSVLRPRGRGHGRRRRALGRADAAGVRARRLLGDPPARRSRRPSSARCRWRSTAWSGSSRPCRSRIRSTTERRRCSSARVEATARDARRGRRGVAAALRARSSRDADDAARRDPRRRSHLPRHPLPLARFGLRALLPATTAGAALVSRRDARAALFAGIAAHSMLPLDAPPSAAFGLMLGLLGHAVGWPFPRGGSQAIADALASLPALARRRDRDRPAGRVARRAAASAARPARRDAARSSLALAGDRLPGGYRRRLERYRYGPGVFKVDWALDGPIPWRAEECAARRPSISAARSRRSPRPSASVGAGPARRAAVRPPRPAEPLRPDPRAGGPAHRLGVLPRSERVYRHRHDGTRSRRRSSASRPGFRGPDPRPLGPRPGGSRARQPELRRRRHQRRSRRPAPAVHPPRRALVAVLDAAAGRLPLLRLDASGRRGARDVRLPRRSRGASEPGSAPDA